MLDSGRNSNLSDHISEQAAEPNTYLDSSPSRKASFEPACFPECALDMAYAAALYTESKIEKEDGVIRFFFFAADSNHFCMRLHSALTGKTRCRRVRTAQNN